MATNDQDYRSGTGRAHKPECPQIRWGAVPPFDCTCGPEPAAVLIPGSPLDEYIDAIAERRAAVQGNDMAFPVLDRQQTPNDTTQLGLTKREYFAAMAMQGFIASFVGDASPQPARTAEAAVAYADALLKRLESGY